MKWMPQNKEGSGTEWIYVLVPLTHKHKLERGGKKETLRNVPNNSNIHKYIECKVRMHENA